jgi:hypothetical protein
MVLLAGPTGSTNESGPPCCAISVGRPRRISAWRPDGKKNVKQTPTNDVEVGLRIVLIAPPAGVDFGIQQGKGSDYTTIQKQRSKGADLSIELTVTVKDNRDDGLPNFLSQLTQGPVTGRFIYIDIGKLAGQSESCWERRIKVPLGGITWDVIEKASTNPKLILEARLPGTGKDGGPSCATVKPVEGWTLSKR